LFPCIYLLVIKRNMLFVVKTKNRVNVNIAKLFQTYGVQIWSWIWIRHQDERVESVSVHRNGDNRVEARAVSQSFVHAPPQSSVVHVSEIPQNCFIPSCTKLKFIPCIFKINCLYIDRVCQFEGCQKSNNGQFLVEKRDLLVA